MHLENILFKIIARKAFKPLSVQDYDEELKHVSIVFARTLFLKNVRATATAETKNMDYF